MNKPSQSRNNVARLAFSDTQTFRWWLQLVDAMDAAEEKTGNIVPCKNAPDLFFSDDEGTPVLPVEARNACKRCPIQDECATYAILANEQHGLWGGTSVTDRKLIRRDVIQRGQQVWFAQNGYFAYRKARVQENNRHGEQFLWSDA